MKQILTIIGLAAATLAGVQAQLVISNYSALTENFDSFAGTSGTIPANWTQAGGSSFSSGGAFGSSTGFYNRADAYSISNYLYALRDTSSSSDISFGGKMASGSSVITLTLNVQNNTGAIVTGFDVAWDVEQYSQAGRATTVNFSYRLGAASFGTINLTGTTLTTATTGTDPATSNLPSIAVTNRTISITGLSMANLSTADFRFSWTNGAGAGSNAHIGVDNFSVTAVPEPKTWVMIGIGTSFMLWNLRRRRRFQG
ncbi:MAG: PEP-CTERM sorting domain-containing protein [Verrucomicrobia bacterium]|nr:PEP-CTERM sorting domain-containing protein [Verrucomicrobiota bacterium]